MQCNPGKSVSHLFHALAICTHTHTHIHTIAHAHNRPAHRGCRRAQRTGNTGHNIPDEALPEQEAAYGGPQDEEDPGTRFHQRLDQAGVHLGHAEGTPPCRGAAGGAMAQRRGGLLADGVQEDPAPAGTRWATRGSGPARCRTARHGGGPGTPTGRLRAGGATHGAKGRSGAHPSVEVVGMRCMEPKTGRYLPVDQGPRGCPVTDGAQRHGQAHSEHPGDG